MTDKEESICICHLVRPEDIHVYRPWPPKHWRLMLAKNKQKVSSLQDLSVDRLPLWDLHVLPDHLQEGCIDRWRGQHKDKMKNTFTLIHHLCSHMNAVRCKTVTSNYQNDLFGMVCARVDFTLNQTDLRYRGSR